jgi:formylmethanofuran dehydrogenase subunit E
MMASMDNQHYQEQEHTHIVVAPGNGTFYCLSCSKPLTARDADEARLAACEVCGEPFAPANGYYEPGEYAYCKDCCHW